MGYFDSQFITEEGSALLAKLAAGKGKIIFTAIHTGDGEYDMQEISRITSRKALKSEKQVAPVNDIDFKEKNTRIRAVISNHELTEGYYIREAGLYARMEGGQEILFSLSVCIEKPTFLPAMGDVPIEMPITNYIAYSGDGNFTIEYRSDVYASLEMVKRIIESIGELSSDMEKAVGNKIDKSGGIMTGDLTATKFHGNLEGIADSAYYSTESGSLKESDTRNDNKAPSWYQIHHPLRTISELKFCGIIGLSSEPELSYCTLITTVPWSDESGGYANQTAICNSGRRYTRTGQENDLWSSWDRLITAKDTATTSIAGITKLYTSTGTSTDGTMTRAAITDTLKWKSIGGSQGLISISLSSITSSYNDIIVEVLCGESESRYVYTWNIARSSLPASSQKGKRLISGYSTGGYSGYCEVLISTSYTQIVKAIVGNREYVGDGAILTIYYR